MNCPNCGSEMGNNALFCSECGKEVADKTEVFDVSVCPECGCPIEPNELFCNNCGHKLDTSDNGFICVKCGKKLKPNAEFCGECGTKVIKGFDVKGNDHPKKDKGVVILVAILLAVIIGCVGAIFFVLHNDTHKIDAPNFNEEQNHTIDDTKSEEITEDTEDIEDMKASENNESETNGMDNNIIKQGENVFSFKYNQSNLLNNPTYTRYTDDIYSFYCLIPDNFIKDRNDTIWYASDGTAKMQIIAKTNSNDLDVVAAMNEYIAEIGGNVSYSASGDTWFAVSIEKDGIDYYMKGFVDHYIREFTFNFPDEYLETYDQYINYIEDNFKRTDV